MEEWFEGIQGEATFGFMIIVAILILGPLLAQKARLPSLIGLLIGGALIGPNALGVLPDFSKLESFGQIGVLYLIFMAGLEIDLQTFAKHRQVSATFGLITTLIPWVLGTVVALFAGFPTKAALLIGSFWASFTLVSYGVVTRFGLSRKPSVSATVGASAITDTIGLLALAIIAGSETGDARPLVLILEVALGLGLLGVYCLVLFPRVCRWFFAGMGQEREVRFLMLFLGLVSASVVADLLGIEPLIGAFFVGIGLNRIVPNESPLMARTTFVGNAIFIPVFLVSVGILVDPAVMFTARTLGLAFGLGAALLAGKAAAAWLTGRIYDFSTAERGLMFSLSSAQAAATLASTIIGYELGLYGDVVVNAVMVVIIVSLFVSAAGSAHFAPRIEMPDAAQKRLGETILLPVTGDEDVTGALWLAGDVAEHHGGKLVPLIVSIAETGDTLEAQRQGVAKIQRAVRGLGLEGDPRLRVDRSIAGGVHSSALEENASMVLLDWHGRRGIRDRLFGDTLDEIAASVDLPIVVAMVQRKPPRRILVAIGERDLEPGRRDELRAALSLAESVAATEGVPLHIGPVAPDIIRSRGLEVPKAAGHLTGPPEVQAWAIQHGTATDLLVALAGARPFEVLEGPLGDGTRPFALVTAHRAVPPYSGKSGTLLQSAL